MALGVGSAGCLGCNWAHLLCFAHGLAFFCVYWFILPNLKPGSRSVSLASVGGVGGQLGLAAAGGAHDLAAGGAEHGGLRVREDGADVEALGALHVQEVAVGGLDKFLKFVHVLFGDRVRVQKVHFHLVYDCF